MGPPRPASTATTRTCPDTRPRKKPRRSPRRSSRRRFPKGSGHRRPGATMSNLTDSPTRAARCAALATILCATLVLPAAAQEAAAPDPGKNQVSRAELQRLLNEYTKTAESRGYSAAFRERARDEAALIRERLTDGDLQ